MYTLVPHADLLHDASGRRIAYEVTTLNPVQLQVAEAEINDDSGRLRAVPAIPVLGCDPVREFRAEVGASNYQADRSHQFTRIAEDKRVYGAVSRLPCGPMSGNPGRRSSVRIRIRNFSCVGNLACPGSDLYRWRVVQAERPEDQPI
jgi:hypothetical protein